MENTHHVKSYESVSFVTSYNENFCHKGSRLVLLIEERWIKMSI